MARQEAQNKVLAANKVLAEERQLIVQYGYSASFSGAENIIIPTAFNPASFQNDWTLRLKFMFFQNSGSNQNLYAQKDGSGPGANGRIYATIRANGALSAYFGGSFKDSDYILKPRKWYDAFVRFDFASYNPGTNIAAGALHYNVNGVAAGDVGSVNVEDAYGDHLIGSSKVPGGFLQDAVICRAELYKIGLSDDEMMEIHRYDKKFLADGDTALDTNIYEHRFEFNEGTGTSVADASGNENDATLSHNSWSNKVPQIARTAIV